MKKGKSLLALLSLSLAFTATTGQVFAKDTHVLGQKYENILDVIEQGKKVQSLKKNTHDPNDIVRFILELSEKPLLDYAIDQEVKDISKYIQTQSAEKIINKIQSQQNKVTNQILKTRAKNVDIIDEYNIVMNGIVVEAPYSELQRLQKIDGVKKVTLDKEYDLVKPVNGYESMAVSSGVMMDSDRVNQEGYSGEGMLAAVLDSGLDTDHEAFQKAPKNPKLTKEDLVRIIDEYDLRIESSDWQYGWEWDDSIGEYGEYVQYKKYDAIDAYKNDKVPYAFDYAGKDADTRGGDSHGTHVSGTVAANSDKLTGVAPDAQLMMMKVFADNGGTSDSIIFAALEDCMILGADSINMSLGSAGGFSESMSSEGMSVYERVMKAGINLMCSAGNDYNAAYLNQYGNDLSLVENPDNGLVGTPSTLGPALSVASVNESKILADYFKVGENKVVYTDTSENEDQKFKNLNGTFEYVVIPNTGAMEDYEGLDVAGKIALIQRGNLSFVEKQQNAQAAGAVAAIIYNNQAGSINMQIDPESVPCIGITLKAGESMIAAETKTVDVKTAYNDFLVTEESNLMSDFSSLGVTPDLKLKPEITAPGGNVYSTLPGNQYGLMSGTSMASPHMAGAALLVKQYVKENYPELSSYDSELLVNNLLMSTTQLVTDSEGVLVTPRKQGAGLANVYDAIHAESYLSVEGNERVKAELGYNEEGKYSFNLTVHNLSDNNKTYILNTTTLTPQIVEQFGKQFIADNARELTEDEVKVTYSVNDKFTVKAHSEIVITVKVELTETGKQNLAVFSNGIFVEGFVQLLGLGANTTDLNVPFMGFYGDWYQAPVYDDMLDGEPFQFGGILGLYDSSWFSDGNIYFTGYNSLTDTIDSNKFSVNSIKDTTKMWTLTPLVGLLRNTQHSWYEVVDSNGKVIYTDIGSFENVKSFYYANGNFTNYMADNLGFILWDYDWDSDDIFATISVPEGDYVYKVYSTLPGDDTIHELDMNFTIDNTEPSLVGTKLVKVETENGLRDILNVKVTDNHHVMGIQITLPDGQGLAYPIGIDSTKKPGEVVSLDIDVTELLEELRANGIEEIAITTVDYAENENISEPININDYSYKVSEDLENVTLTGEEYVKENETYVGTLKADDGYDLPTTVEVTMNEKAVGTYDPATGTITVENITGDILIKAKGVAWDKTVLIDAIAKAETISSDNYTSETYSALTKTLEKAKEVLENGQSQSDFDKAANELFAAIEALAYKSADYSKLNEAVTKAESLNKEDYKDFSKVEEALKAIDYDKNITEQDAVDAMYDALIKAMNELVKVEKDTTQENNKDNNTSGADTGDYMNSTFYFMTIIMSACALVVLKKRKKINNI